MSANRTRRAGVKALAAKIREALMKDWDPIGVQGFPVARDEYDEYALRIAGMLFRRCKSAVIEDYLHEVETQRMGLRGNRERARAVAEKIAELEIRSAPTPARP